MAPTFFNVKMVYRTESRSALSPRCRSFSPVGERWGCDDSCRTQIGQAFQVPTDTFELQFQSVGLVPHIPHSPVARAALPPTKHLLNLTPDRTEQPVHSHIRVLQLFPSAGLAQNPVGHAVPTTPHAAFPTPIRLVGHDHFLIALHHVLKLLAVMHAGR